MDLRACGDLLLADISQLVNYFLESVNSSDYVKAQAWYNFQPAAGSLRKKRVLVVANKWWECDPALGALLNDNARPLGFPWPNPLQPPRKRPDQNHLPKENDAPLVYVSGSCISGKVQLTSAPVADPRVT